MLDRIDVGAVRPLLARRPLVYGGVSLLTYGPQMLVLLLLLVVGWLRSKVLLLLLSAIIIIVHHLAPILPYRAGTIILRKLQPLKVLSIRLGESCSRAASHHGPLLLQKLLLLTLEQILLHLPLNHFFFLILYINLLLTFCDRRLLLGSSLQTEGALCGQFRIILVRHRRSIYRNTLIQLLLLLLCSRC